jgi:hypothetical protein
MGTVLRVDKPPYDERVSPLFGMCRRDEISGPFSDGLVVDWSHATFVSASQMTAAASVQRYASERYGCSIGMVKAHGNAASYMYAMGYAQVLSRKSDWSSMSHGGDNYSTIRAIETDGTAQDVAGSISSVLSANLSSNGTVHDAIDYSFGEIVDNVINHSGSPCGGFASAQYMPKREYVELCVADCGVGIARTMSRNSWYSGLSDQQLVVKAFDEGEGENVGSGAFVSPNGGAGKGLATAAALVRATHGHLWVVSKDVDLSLSDSGFHETLGGHYPGTVITMRIPVGDGVSLLESDIFSDGGDHPFGFSASEGLYDPSDVSDVLW